MFINARMTLLLATAVLNIKQYHHHPYIDKMLKVETGKSCYGYTNSLSTL